MNNISLFFVILSIVAGILIFIAGIFGVQSNTFEGIIVGGFLMIFGLSTIILELFFPPTLLSWLGFYSRWVGKGLWFIFLGFVVYSDNPLFNQISGIFLIVLGVIYALLHCARQVDAPQPIRTQWN
mmetsp:Transcript_9375/g.29817  ORF Transcript_9375/g.29817 Transcript_9375/m.29817 type:complete len:126 (-) Transcript_9375:153-530(-)